MSNNIVILGAGYGGVSAAKKLNKLFKKDPNTTITLIDKNPYHTLLTEIHEVAGNRIDEDGVKVNLERLFESTKVNIIKDKIENIDFDNQTLKSNKHHYTYDYLILGTGSKPSDCGVEGVREHAFTLWSIDDANNIQEHVKNNLQEARMTDDPELRKELLSFAVCGGGFTGIEMIGELIDWIDTYTKKYNLPREEVNIYSCEGLDTILPTLNDKLVEKAKNYLKKNDVNIMTGDFVKKIEENKLIFEDDTEVKVGTIIWTCGVEASDFAANSGLTTDRANRLEVNKYLQTTDYENVYAVGDNAAAPGKETAILPALVEAAMQTGECAAENIAADIRGEEKEELEPNLHGIMVSIGSKFAVAEVMGMSLKGAPAMFMKHSINMHYLFDIGGLKEGFGLVDNYLEEQGSNKGMIAQLFDHISQKSRALWLVPLRIFIGVMWLLSGLEKIHNGWLASGDKLVAGATASPIGPNPVDWYVDLVIEQFIFPNPLFFQWVVTLTELALAVSLILGLFSTLGALGSIGMSINFFLSGFAIENPELKWYLMSSIAILGKSGRSFGLDYYVLPWLKNLIWKRPKDKNEDLQKVVEK